MFHEGKCLCGQPCLWPAANSFSIEGIIIKLKQRGRAQAVTSAGRGWGRADRRALFQGAAQNATQITRSGYWNPQKLGARGGLHKVSCPGSKIEAPLGKMVLALTPGPYGRVVNTMVRQGPVDRQASLGGLGFLVLGRMCFMCHL